MLVRRIGMVVGLAVIAALGVACGATSVTPSGSTSAKVVDTTYPSTVLHANRHVLVLLPPGYGRSGQRYPVVELLHGSPGAGPEQVINVLGLPALSNRSKTPFIAVAPDGNGPVVEESDYANTSRQSMGAATGPELRQWVAAHYATNGSWYVSGLSSGGYGSAYLPTLTPGAYQGSCPMSGFFTARPPAFEGQSRAVLDAGSPILHVSARGPRTLLVSGAGDADSIDQAHRYIAAMNAVGQPNSGLVLDPGGHEIPVWVTGIRQCLAYFFPTSGLGG